MLELIAGLVGAIFVAFITFAIAVHSIQTKHERRLTRVENKVDLLLLRNGVDPSQLESNEK